MHALNCFAFFIDQAKHPHHHRPRHPLLQVKWASRQAGVSTASMGKFDQRVKGEKKGERTPMGKRRKFMPVSDTGKEREALTDMADKFLRQRSDDVLDIKRAMGKMESEAREERRVSKKKNIASGGSSSKAGSKGKSTGKGRKDPTGRGGAGAGRGGKSGRGGRGGGRGGGAAGGRGGKAGRGGKGKGR